MIENTPAPQIIEVFSVSAMKEAECFKIDLELIDLLGDRYRTFYVSQPDDTFGLNPNIRKWLADNAGTFSIEPYVQPPIGGESVDAERDRRIALGFTFDGVRYQFRPEDEANITGAGSLAGLAIAAGAEAGDLRWADLDHDFAWIAEDNSLHPMDAETMFAFSKAAMAHKQAHIFAGRALKNMDPIPADYATNDVYWP
ncbi:DUF4376 domain-containing protein [Rhizobium halophytocola]|uniref:DUF4376 domain-containing protein n=1 Tax=Rhizobium halophytocola TaxID=735519 RepID=A0ABS4E2F4_9HYPH|nr:DUF4376 domain-containing protein [Rhizobium halophytocola]MBP1852113.1 hypothetical protein [Rhizobium halophytocola]